MSFARLNRLRGASSFSNPQGCTSGGKKIDLSYND